MIAVVPTGVHFRSIVRNFLMFYKHNTKHYQTEISDISTQLHRKCFTTDAVSGSCISRIKTCFVWMIEIIPPYHTFRSTRQRFCVECLVTSKIRILKQCSRMNLMPSFLGTLKILISSYAVSVKYIFRTWKPFYTCRKLLSVIPKTFSQTRTDTFHSLWHICRTKNRIRENVPIWEKGENITRPCFKIYVSSAWAGIV